MKKILIALTITISLSANAAYSETSVAATGSSTPKAVDHKKKILATLSKEKMALFTKMVTAQKAQAAIISKKSRALNKELKSMLLSENFNKNAYLKKATELTNLHSSKYKARTMAIAELASKLTPVERKVLIDAFASRKYKSRKK